MKFDILGFGIVREIFGNDAVATELPDKATVGDLKSALESRYPELRRLASYMIACDNHYAETSTVLSNGNEIAVIPPVSGG